MLGRGSTFDGSGLALDALAMGWEAGGRSKRRPATMTKSTAAAATNPAMCQSRSARAGAGNPGGLAMGI